jgi:heme-degrading monooxygenase HmoA
MNLFSPPKRLTKLSLRRNEHPFVLLSLFIFEAKKQKWTKSDIKKVVTEAKKGSNQHLIQTLKAHINIRD